MLRQQMQFLSRSTSASLPASLPGVLSLTFDCEESLAALHVHGGIFILQSAQQGACEDCCTKETRSSSKFGRGLCPRREHAREAGKQSLQALLFDICLLTAASNAGVREL